MIQMSVDELIQLINGLKQQKESSTFATNPITPIIPDLKAEELVKPLSPLDLMSDEEIKYYSTPRYDQILAEKEAHAQKLKDEGKL